MFDQTLMIIFSNGKSKNLCPTMFHRATVRPKRWGRSLLYQTPLNIHWKTERGQPNANEISVQVTMRDLPKKWSFPQGGHIIKVPLYS